MMRTIYAILGYPLGWIMFLCYHLVNNYGLALILFTILTKLVLVPFAVNSRSPWSKWPLSGQKWKRSRKNMQITRKSSMRSF